MRTSTLIVPNEISYLSAIQAFARETAGAVGFDKNDAEKILLALEEAVTNIIQHAYEEGEQASFEVLFEPLTTGLKITLKDKGLPFYPEKIAEYTTPTDVDHVPIGLGSLYLNLRYPETALLCGEFEKLGFFIAGVLPFSHVGDALILQYLNNVFIDYDKIQVASETLEAIRAYVRSHDRNLT